MCCVVGLLLQCQEVVLDEVGMCKCGDIEDVFVVCGGIVVVEVGKYMVVGLCGDVCVGGCFLVVVVVVCGV